MANPAPGFKARPGHNITLQPASEAVAAKHGDTIVALSQEAVLLVEDRYPQRAYFLPADVLAKLTKTAKTTHCPFKGDAAYFDVEFDGVVLENAAWAYESPFDEMTTIKGLIAFDDRFTIS
ncbi:MAG: DUF427 domain-containing protein [Pseudomonadota bacterium]